MDRGPAILIGLFVVFMCWFLGLMTYAVSVDASLAREVAARRAEICIR